MDKINVNYFKGAIPVFLILVIFSPIHINGQGIDIGNGTKLKNIKLGTKLLIRWTKDEQAKVCENCIQKTATGILKEVTENSIILEKAESSQLKA